MDFKKYCQLDKLISNGQYEKLEKILKEEKVRLDTQENATDGRYLIASAWNIPERLIGQKIVKILEKYGVTVSEKKNIPLIIYLIIKQNFL